MSAMDSKYQLDVATLEKQIRERAGSSVVILDTRPVAAYEEGHIPGAVHLDLFDYFVDTSQEGVDRLNEELTRILGEAGIGDAARVVCYEDEMGMRATRVLWLIEYAGHPDVHVLEGGFKAWKAAGGAICHEPCKSAPRLFEVHVHPEILATADYVGGQEGPVDRGAVTTARGGQAVLDVRSLAEHRGETTSSHGPCCPRAGRIPGSIWLEWTNLLTADRSGIKPAAEIRRLLAERGVTPEQEVVTYCHRGARAAAAYVALKEAGFERVRNYIGSWHEWAGIPRLPVTTG